MKATRLIPGGLVAAVLAILLVASGPALAQYSQTSQSAVSANGNGTGIATSGYACVAVQVVSSATPTATVNIQQSVDGSTWTTVDSVSNPTTAAVYRSGPGANYTRTTVSGYSGSGTITTKVGWGACDAGTGWKAQASIPYSGTDITDGHVFIPAWSACAATTPSATLVATRAAANDWNLTRTAAGAETYSISCSLGSFLQRTTASKGIKITSVKVVHQITVAALTSNSAPTIKTVTYANNTANALANFGGTITATMPTATQANPYVTTIGLGTPAYFNTADSDLTIDWTAVMQNTGVYAVQGVIVGFTKTDP